MSTRENSEDGQLVVELSEEQAAPAGRRRWLLPTAAIGVAVVLVGGLVGLLLSREEKKDPTPAEVLAEVQAFVKEARTATFVSTSEHTFAPESGDGGVGHSSVTRARATGQFQLPDRAHVIADEGDWAEEYIVNGNEHYGRSADGVAGLSAEKWVRWVQEDASVEDFAFGGGPAGLATETAGGFLSMFAGTMTDFSELFAELKAPEQAAPNRIRATVPLADVVPDEVKQMMEKLRREMAEEDPEADAMLPSFEGTLAVTVEYGDNGRLDVLHLEIDQDQGEDRSAAKEEVRFADWGKPVTIPVPGADQVDATPHIEEELVAAAQKRFTVLAVTPPAGWQLVSATAEEADEENETCASVDLTYMPPGVDLEEYFAEDDAKAPPTLTVSSTDPSCPWADDYVPALESSRRVRIGAATAEIGPLDDDDFSDFMGSSLAAMLTVQGTPVSATTSLPEAELVAVLRTLAPLHLSKQPVAPAPTG